MDSKIENILPASPSDIDLANRFTVYFNSKIENLRSQFSSQIVHEPSVNQNISQFLMSFQPVTPQEIKDIITTYPIKCSKDDPIHAKLLNSA